MLCWNIIKDISSLCQTKEHVALWRQLCCAQVGVSDWCVSFVKDGEHQCEDSAPKYTDDQLKLIQSQDLRYVQYKLSVEQKVMDALSLFEIIRCICHKCMRNWFLQSLVLDIHLEKRLQVEMIVSTFVFIKLQIFWLKNCANEV